MQDLKTLEISRLSHQGDGIAFDDDKTWFISKALPGEQVSAQAYQQRGRNIFARCTQVLRAAPERIEPHCELANVCGGCDFQHVSIEDQRNHKRQVLLDQLTRLGKIDHPAITDEPIVGEAWGYRERVRFIVERQTDQLHLAYRAPASSSPLRVRTCPVLHPTLQAALPGITQWANQCPKSLIQKELKVALGEDGRIGIAVDGRGVPASFDGPIVDFKGQSLNDQPSLHYTSLNNLRIQFSAADFSQVNTELNRRVTERLIDWLRPEGRRVLELFCGIGNFSIPIAQQASELIALDSQQKQLNRADTNALANSLSNVQFKRADLYKKVQLEIDNTTPVLVDPPRTGLGDVIKPLLKAQPPRICYLSCDSASFAKDAGKIARNGYRLSRLSYVDFFAQTGKIESMGLFESA